MRFLYIFNTSNYFFKFGYLESVELDSSRGYKGEEKEKKKRKRRRKRRRRGVRVKEEDLVSFEAPLPVS